MDACRGSSLHLLGFVCVFALVFASNVAVVKVCPLEVSKFVVIMRAIELDEPDNLNPFSSDLDQFRGNYRNPRTPGLLL